MPKAFRHRLFAFRPNRYAFLLLVFGGLFSIIIARLFQLQVVQYDHYRAAAREQHFGSLKLPAKRGEILVRDRSGTYYKLATNVTLDLLYVDPLWVDRPGEIAKSLPPLLYDVVCRKQSEEDCRDALVEFEEALTPTRNANVNGQIVENVPDPKRTITREEGERILASYVSKALDQKEVTRVVLKTFVEHKEEDDAMKEKIKALNLTGIHVSATALIANPVAIADRDATARSLAPVIGMGESELTKKIERRSSRYVRILNRIPLDISEKIRSLGLKGVVLVPEHWRYYPEKGLAAQVVGFVNADGEGEYGVERKMNDRLRGEAGYVNSENDLLGRQLTIGENDIQQAKNGDSFVLTIDRIVQAEVEKRLERAVNEFDANSGEIVVMDPYTGAVIAMAQYPTFDPNAYRDAYATKEIRYDPGKAMTVIKEKAPGVFLTYANKFGPWVFANQMVSSLYDPGSIFKPLTVAIGLDTGEIRPNGSYRDTGVIEVDEYEIHNVSDACLGTNTYEHALNYSCNIGMVNIAKKLGRNLFYNYILNFGFGERTDIEAVDNETKGVVKHVRSWAASNLATISFGQGISVTPLQMAVAYSALANGGLILEPRLVSEIHHGDGRVEATSVQVVRRVISKETSDTITAMLVSSVEKGVARRAKLPQYYVAGKTGTSQIAKEGSSGFEEGNGTTIASFGGYAPANKPKFVMIVKIMRPRTSPWGDSTAAVVFGDLAEFLMEYYTVPPER